MDVRALGPFSLREFLRDEATELDESPLKEAQAATLRELGAAYAAGCRFRAGDLVTPRATSPIKGAGRPHIVIEVFSEPLRFAGDESGPNSFHANFDISVVCYAGNGHYAAFVGESWQYEPYTGPGADLSETSCVRDDDAESVG